MWDVFISHAWEDKETIARPLADVLSEAGLRVWYDELTLTLGDILRRSIDRGLAESRYGVVIQSPHFFAKEWPQRELDGLTAREVSSGKTILPVWHNVTREDVERFSLTLADKLGVSTARELDVVVREILRTLRPGAATVPGAARESHFVLSNRAEANLVAGRYDDAIRDATEALSIEPRSARVLRIRAAAYRRLGRYDDAIRDAEQSLRIEPGNTFALDTIKRSRSAKG